MSFIANNTVLSNFASIGRLDILKQTFRILRISEEVWLEIKKGLETGYSYQYETLKATQDKDAWIKVVMVDDKERSDFVEFSQKLGYGESSSIAIARHRDWVFLTDDKRARGLATKKGVSVVGSVGLLKSAVDRELLELLEADKLLVKMIRSGYFSPIESISDLYPT
jgi:predicted nucleic acid-binding protein